MNEYIDLPGGLYVRPDDDPLRRWMADQWRGGCIIGYCEEIPRQPIVGRCCATCRRPGDYNMTASEWENWKGVCESCRSMGGALWTPGGNQ